MILLNSDDCDNMRYFLKEKNSTRIYIYKKIYEFKISATFFRKQSHVPFSFGLQKTRVFNWCFANMFMFDLKWNDFNTFRPPNAEVAQFAANLQPK